MTKIKITIVDAGDNYEDVKLKLQDDAVVVDIKQDTTVSDQEEQQQPLEPVKKGKQIKM
jgi:HSP20 family molecular chaperone IbpA